jgi:HAE1 family hydrophobic/amphiphilic exporter-1
MCSRILKPHRAAERHGRLFMAFERGFDACRDAYEASLRWTLGHRRAVLLLFLGICLATGVLFARAPKGFLPSEDSGQLFCFIEGPQDISFEAMNALQHQVANIILQDPNVDTAMSFVGATGFSPSLNLGRMASDPGSPTSSARRCSSRTCRRSASAASSPRAPTST